MLCWQGVRNKQGAQVYSMLMNAVRANAEVVDSPFATPRKDPDRPRDRVQRRLLSGPSGASIYPL